MPGVSQRGYGTARFVKKSGQRVEEVLELTITGYDLVLEPSDPSAGVTIVESKEAKEMDPQEILEALQESGFFDRLAADVRQNVVEAMRADDEARQESALREALGIKEDDDITEAVLALVKQQPNDLEASLRESLGLKETDDLAETLEERARRLEELEAQDRQRQVAAYIDEQTKELRYPDFLKAQLVEAIKAGKPNTIEEAKKALVEKRKEYDGIMAQLELAAKGFGGVKILGPVLERETGVPEFARGAHLLTEAMVKTGQTPARQWNRPLEELSPGRAVRADVSRSVRQGLQAGTDGRGAGD